MFINKTGFSITVHVKSAATTKKKELSLSGINFYKNCIYNEYYFAIYVTGSGKRDIFAQTMSF